MSVDPKALLQDLRREVGRLEDDLREQIGRVPELSERLRTEYGRGREAGRIGDAFEAWTEAQITQAAVHWVLATVFIRFIEDNGLIASPVLSGPGDRARTAAERQTLYFRGRPTDNDRHYLLHVFGEVAALRAGQALFDREHNPVWSWPISAEAARELIRFWRRVHPDTGRLEHDFTDGDWNTRFLGDLYQELSEAAKKKFALLQTPEFVEEFILDRTLEPAIQEFGLENVRMIDPTGGSGHFLLGGFHRLLKRWQTAEPAVEPRKLIQKALHGVYGVDLNPFAVAIARFRLLIAALKAANVERLDHNVPGFKIHLAAADSLLFGVREGELALDDAAANLRARRMAFHAEDADAAHHILSQRYHAVVGNPPYITVKDRALNRTYREIYRTCHMKYALSVPFIERFWQLAIPGQRGEPAGYVGMINADSFMKREFGKKVVEDFFPTVDLTHVIHTSGAYIPGHGTPTVILFGRNRPPVGETVRAVMGIKGEPSTPADPARGLVWTAIVNQVDAPGSESEFVGVADMPREPLGKHPWSIGGGGAAELKESIDPAGAQSLASLVDSIGFMSITGEDEVFIDDGRYLANLRAPVRMMYTGDGVRDWASVPAGSIYFPYDDNLSLIPPNEKGGLYPHLWAYRTPLRNRLMFGKLPEESGVEWFEPRYLARDRARAVSLITFAEVATHNHFVLDRGGKVFNRTAPVIKLPAGASEAEHLALLGLLNSSTACFWLRQVCFPKGGDHVGNEGARVRKSLWDERYAFNATNIGQFPVASERPLDLATRLDSLARERQQHLPSQIAAQLPMPRVDWLQHRTDADRLLRELIALQEELDWRCYRIYGITPDELTYRGGAGRPATPPELRLGERAFEIVLARRMAADEEETTWFERHGSTPITQIPAHWPEDYRRLVEKRIALIESDRYVGLVERPEYKRRWNVESWDDQAAKALRGWLLDRLESARYWPEPRLRTTRDLAADAERDQDFMAVAELYLGHGGFDVHGLVRDLAESEAVPFLPVLRYKPSGLRKRAVWERTWELQRLEDAIDVAVAAELKQQTGESESEFAERLSNEQKRRKAAEVGDIPRPPKYTAADFTNTAYWRLRGALDVPKERFIAYPHCGREGETSLLLGWAGWDHLQQAQALAGWYHDVADGEGWPAERRVPILAGIAQLVPWLEQWHNDFDPEHGYRLGDFFSGYLDQQLQLHHLTREALAAWTPPTARRTRRRRVTT